MEGLRLITGKRTVWLLLSFLLFYVAVPAFAAKGGKDGKDDPIDIIEDLDFKIQNQSLISVNESSFAISKMTSNLGNPLYPAKNAKDQNLDTFWSDFISHRASSYLKVDFGEKIVVTKVHIINYVDINAGMASFDLEYYKSAGWVKVGTYKTSGGDDERIEIDVPEISTDMLRITNFKLDTGKNCVGIKEFQVNTPVLFASSSDSSSPSSNANDGNYKTYWSNCSSSEADDFLEVDLGKVVVVTSVHIVNYVDADMGLESFDLEYYNGVEWKKIGSYTTGLFSKEIIEIKVPGINSQHLRITSFSLGSGKSCIGIVEFQVNTPMISSNESDDVTHLPFSAGDEDVMTYWGNCDDYDETDYLKIDLGNIFRVSRVEVTNYYPETGDAGMQVFDLEYFDGDNWITIDTYKGVNRHQSFFNIRFSEVIEAKRFRLTNFETGSSRSCVGLSEVAFFTPDRNYYSLYYEGSDGEKDSPQITAIELSEEEVSSDNSEPRDIIVTGINFIEAPSENFIHFTNETDSFELENSSGTSTQLFATVPEDAVPGIYDVHVTNENGTSNILSDAYEVVDKDADFEPTGGLGSVNTGEFGICFVSTSINVTMDMFSSMLFLLLTLLVSTIAISHEKKHHFSKKE